MDPFEFEGTVVRHSEVLNAGKLEELFSGPTKFTMLDMSKESGDIYLSIYNLQQILHKQQDNQSLDVTMAQMDEQALKLAELKEDYLKRRKALSAKVKNFFASKVDSTSSSDAVQELIEAFKKEFDNLSSLAKFSESAFLSAYKHIREVPDFPQLVDGSLTACLKLQELIKRAQEQLNIADTLLKSQDDDTSHHHQQIGQQRHAHEMEILRQQFGLEKEEMRQQCLSDLMDMKSQQEVELRRQEQALDTRYEQGQLEQQQRLDSLLAGKDSHIAALIQSLQEYQQKSLLYEERGRLLESEDIKRRVLDDKLREALLSNAELASTFDRYKLECDGQMQQLQGRLQSAETERAAQQATLSEVTARLQTSGQELSEATQQLALRPPIDFEMLAGKVGFHPGEPGACNWMALETFLIESSRRLSSENITLRLRDQDSSKQLSQLAKSFEQLQQELRTREEEVRELEREIGVAQQANRSARTPSARRSITMIDKEREGAGQLGPFDGLSFDLDLESQDPALAPDQALFTAKGGGTEQLMEVLQHQRDRYMRSVQSTQTEVATLRSKLERLQGDQIQLRNENLELYRRLRVLRLSQGNSNGNASRSAEMRSRRTSGRPELDEEEHAEDVLDHKYHALYEEELSPFRVAELDKHQVLSKMHIVDRVMAAIHTHVMQDSWTRQAFVWYLALVHLFALIYCFKTLNPELAGELDAHLQAKYSRETFDLPEHPDN
jgi:hypothetical protein